MEEEFINNSHEPPVTSGKSKDANKYPLGSNFSKGETKASIFGIKLTRREQEQENSIIKPCGNNSLDEERMTVLRGLLKKANPEELEIMHRILCGESGGPEWRAEPQH